MPGTLLHSAMDSHGVVDRNVRGCRDISQSFFSTHPAQIQAKISIPNIPPKTPGVMSSIFAKSPWPRPLRRSGPCRPRQNHGPGPSGHCGPSPFRSLYKDQRKAFDEAHSDQPCSAGSNQRMSLSKIAVVKFDCPAMPRTQVRTERHAGPARHT